LFVDLLAQQHLPDEGVSKQRVRLFKELGRAKARFAAPVKLSDR
tara:strand:+ start:89 stop:220 length:132 start_codon:yes stop_codon:yes gene_type:complete